MVPALAPNPKMTCRRMIHLTMPMGWTATSLVYATAINHVSDYVLSNAVATSRILATVPDQDGALQGLQWRQAANIQ